MIAVDSSVLIAILRREPEADAFLHIIAGAGMHVVAQDREQAETAREAFRRMARGVTRPRSTLATALPMPWPSAGTCPCSSKAMTSRGPISSRPFRREQWVRLDVYLRWYIPPQIDECFIIATNITHTN